MSKLFPAFGLYWHVLLDLILTHVYVIAFLNAGYASIAGLLMAIDAMFKVVLLVFLSRLTVRFPLAMRGRFSVFLRFILVGIWFSAIMLLPITSVSLLVLFPFMLFKLVLALDSSLSTDFIFLLQEYFDIDISQSAAAMNILVRAGTSVAPAIALMFLTTEYASWVVVILALFSGILSTILLREVFFSQINLSNSSHKKHMPFTALIKNPLMRWGLSFQFLGNLSFSGVAFLLLAQLQLNGDVFLNEITVLYAAFFIAQFIVLIFGDVGIPGNKPMDMIKMFFLCAFFVFVAGFGNYFIRLSVCGLIGITYSFLLSGGQKIITSQFRGNGFIEYMSWAQMVGRLTSFGSTATLGFMLNFGVTSSLLLVICGGIGVFSALLLMNLIPSKIELALETRNG